MGFFKRKNRKQITSSATECQHLWKDFPWYIEGEFNDNKSQTEYNIFIYEPYVCVKCKERKDIVLNKVYGKGIYATHEGFKEKFNDLRKKYADYCLDKVIIEDMINDFQMVDRRALRWLGYMKQFGQEDDLKLVFERANGEKVEIKLGDE